MTKAYKIWAKRCIVNAGAISACSMVQPIGDSAKKWDAIVGNVTDLCGHLRYQVLDGSTVIGNFMNPDAAS